MSISSSIPSLAALLFAVVQCVCNLCTETDRLIVSTYSWLSWRFASPQRFAVTWKPLKIPFSQL